MRIPARLISMSPSQQQRKQEAISWLGDENHVEPTTTTDKGRKNFAKVA
jgi:hypothetical protein